MLRVNCHGLTIHFHCFHRFPWEAVPYIAHKKGNASENVLDGSLFTFYFFVSAGRQQIRGSWTPVSFPRIRLPPKAVRSTTCPGRLSVTRPIMAACSPPEVGAARPARRPPGRGNNRQHPSFAGAVERVQPQEVTGGGHRRIDGDRVFLQFNGQGAAFDKFVERVATPPRVGSRRIRTPPASTPPR